MSDLEKYRKEMENITWEMLVLLEKRLDLSKNVAAYKKANNMPVFQPEREQLLLDKYVKEGPYKQEVKDFMIKLFELSKNVQKKEVEK